MADMEKDIIELQTIVAHQAEDIATLSHELYVQQKELALLKQQMGQLIDRFRSLAEAAPQDKAPEPPPPHY